MDTEEVCFEEGPQASRTLLLLSVPDLLGQAGGAVLQGALLQLMPTVEALTPGPVCEGQRSPGWLAAE